MQVKSHGVTGSGIMIRKSAGIIIIIITITIIKTQHAESI